MQFETTAIKRQRLNTINWDWDHVLRLLFVSITWYLLEGLALLTIFFGSHHIQLQYEWIAEKKTFDRYHDVCYNANTNTIKLDIEHLFSFIEITTTNPTLQSFSNIAMKAFK